MYLVRVCVASDLLDPVDHGDGSFYGAARGVGRTTEGWRAATAKTGVAGQQRLEIRI